MAEKNDPWQRNHLIRDAIGQSIYEAMKQDSAIHLFGEGAHMKVHFDAPDIEREFPERVHTLPISEDGNTNFAVGAALVGVKPVVDIITADFMYRAMDSICNTAAKLNDIDGGKHQPKTIVIRGEFLTGGPTTGQRPEALFAHIPGLRVVVPSTPKDAYRLMTLALTDPGVTVFFEDRMILDSEMAVEDLELVPDNAFTIGSAVVRQAPETISLTVATYGLTRQMTEAVVSSHFPHVELIDLLSLYPIDWHSIEMSLRRSGKLLVVEPDVQFGGIGAEIVATIAERFPAVRVGRLGAPRETISASDALQGRYYPTHEQINDAISRMLS